LKDIEQQMITQALEKTRGSFQRAAAMLGISKRTLSRKLRRYEMEDAHCMAA
jgi:DNA-binding NtrC family response regulator